MMFTDRDGRQDLTAHYEVSDPFGFVFVRCGILVAILASAAAIHLHLVSLSNAGGLWRDEVSSANVATLPSFRDMWEALPHDSFPILFPAVTRLWSVTVGATDTLLRRLGLMIGLLLLVSLWVSGWMIWRGPPVLSLTLLALNVVVIRYGDSVRAYGVATGLAVLTMALTWRFVERQTLLRGITATVIATLSVQALYQNAVFVLAMCVAGCMVYLVRGRHFPALKVLAIGVIPALSLAPYVRPLVLAQDWWMVSKYGLTPSLVENNIFSFAAHPAAWFSYVWALVVVVAITLGLLRAVSSKRSNGEYSQQSLAVFATITLVLSLVGFGIFLAAAKLPTQPWYFFPAFALAIVCCDALFSGTHWIARSGVLICALIVTFLAYSTGLSELKYRQTDGDLVALRIAQRAGPEDLIVVNPWYCGLTFNRYYRGNAPWKTLPDLKDYRYHRYDFLKAKMQLEHPAQPVLDHVAATLRAGHSVWLVGWLPQVPFGMLPPQDLPPAPHGRFGWLDEPYSLTWGAQMYYLIATRARNVEWVADPAASRVNPLEDMQLFVATGWRESGSLD